jgi:hypothetical protein
MTHSAPARSNACNRLATRTGPPYTTSGPTRRDAAFSAAWSSSRPSRTSPPHVRVTPGATSWTRDALTAKLSIVPPHVFHPSASAIASPTRLTLPPTQTGYPRPRAARTAATSAATRSVIDPWPSPNASFSARIC